MNWKEVDKTVKSETFEAVAGLDALCFNIDGYERMTTDRHIYGDIYALSENGILIGYAVYGQVWLPEHPYGYITRIGVRVEDRQKGYGLKMLEYILTDFYTRSEPKCPIVFADIRESNTASRQLFRKAGFHFFCEFDDIYPDEKGIRVKKGSHRRRRCKNDSHDYRHLQHPAPIVCRGF